MTTAINDPIAHIDWTFRDAPYKAGLHSIHPYPAKFIPEIPRKLIELFHNDKNSIVLDPFCGSGTTLVEAVTTGAQAWGIDVNPLACLLAKVKTTPLPVDLQCVGGKVLEEAKERLLAGEYSIPSIPRLNHWFKADVQRALASLVAAMRKVENSHVKEALSVALSGIIVRVSNQESDTRYAAIEKKVSGTDVFREFAKQLAFVGHSLRALAPDLFQVLGKAHVLHNDILDVVPSDLPNNVGLVITSPPYPNAYEYWLYHKYRMYWLDMDPIWVREREIGARPHFFKSKPQTERDFERQMDRCFALLSQVMLKNSKACFLVGRSVIHGRRVDNVKLLRRAAELHGFILHAISERQIPMTRKTFNPANSKIASEHIVVFNYARPDAASLSLARL